MNSQIPGPTDMSDGVMTPEKNYVKLLFSRSVGREGSSAERTEGDSGLDTNSEFYTCRNDGHFIFSFPDQPTSHSVLRLTH